MNYLVIALAFGDGEDEDAGMTITAVRFFTRQAALEATDWLNSKDSIYEAKLIVDAFEER